MQENTHQHQYSKCNGKNNLYGKVTPCSLIAMFVKCDVDSRADRVYKCISTVGTERRGKTLFEFS